MSALVADGASADAESYGRLAQRKTPWSARPLSHNLAAQPEPTTREIGGARGAGEKQRGQARGR
jgi:hypothetical protein